MRGWGTCTALGCGARSTMVPSKSRNRAQEGWRISASVMWRERSKAGRPPPDRLDTGPGRKPPTLGARRAVKGQQPDAAGAEIADPTQEKASGIFIDFLARFAKRVRLLPAQVRRSGFKRWRTMPGHAPFLPVARHGRERAAGRVHARRGPGRLSAACADAAQPAARAVACGRARPWLPLAPDARRPQFLVVWHGAREPARVGAAGADRAVCVLG